LQSISASIDGAHPEDFRVVTPPSSTVQPFSETTFQIEFTPRAGGQRTANLQLVSNDPNKPTYQVVLTAFGESDLSPAFNSPSDVPITTDRLNASGLNLGTISLGFAPVPGTMLTAVQVKGDGLIEGTLVGLPDQSRVTVSFGGKDYTFQLSYRGGDGNDLVFYLVGPGLAEGNFSSTADQYVTSIAIQSDGTTYVSGEFTQIGGQPHFKIARLKPDGAVDPLFNLSAAYRAEGLEVTKNDEILVAATVTSPDGFQRLRLARLFKDGSIDRSFQPDIDGTTQRILELRDGRILIGGIFTRVNGVSCGGLAILHPDGSLDRSFSATLGDFLGTAYALAQQEDGKLIVGGPFISVNGANRRYAVRLNPNGSIDQTFNPNLVSSTHGVSSLTIQSDGKILMGGYFTSVRGVPRSCLVRLNPDSTIDTSFIGTTSSSVTSILVQKDGRILIGGLFSSVNGITQRAIARLLPDGNIESTFAPQILPSGQGSIVYSIGMLRDGRLLAAGSFDNFAGGYSSNLSILSNGSVESEVQIDGSDIIWNRSGSLLDLRQASFEFSGDSGETWSLLGEGNRTPEGWKLSGVTLPGSGFVRAKGSLVSSNRSSHLAAEIKLSGRSLTALESWR
jgi:uncharacterized delta-60 repeat protein